jgi:deoxyribodipyrimidine photo-lyase
MNVLVWFKRDLRLSDHPALTHAAGLGPVLPVYVAEPEVWTGPDASARQWEFVAESLADLRRDLAALGLPLVIRTGDAVEVLARLCRQHRITAIVSHEETGNSVTYARDRRVAAWARGEGITWTELPQSGVTRRLASRDGWASKRDAFVAAPMLPIPPLSPLAAVEPGPIPTARSLRLPPDPCPNRQRGGRSQGLQLLDSFLAQRGETYRSAMSSPLTGERACSRLSPHLAWGTLSVREVAQATTARQEARPGGRWGGALTSFQYRLAWRDHFIQKLEDQPAIETRDLHPLAVTRPRDSDAARLHAWETGETGLPFLDACLRYLRATGWLNFRMRAMVTSFASYHLWLDWRVTGKHLARQFTDYEPGIHWPQVQMQSGTTGINIPRIYNPVKQGQDQDPTGAFTRAWVPELAGVPDPFLHEPWKWPEARRLLGHRYPEPVVDAAAAARAARDLIWQARKAPGFAETASAIVRRHASRADPRFVNDRSPRRPAPSGQLTLDL